MTGIQDLGPEQYLLADTLWKDRPILMVAGGDPIGTLYGAYRLAEHLGVRFYLHGDVIPDQKIPLALPRIHELGKPLFDRRGIQPFHDFPEGPDWWELDAYKAYIGQLPKLRMNFFGLHTYPEGGVGPEPLTWIGTPDQIADGGRVKASYPARHFTAASGTWGYGPMKTGDYYYGAAALFDRDDFGADYMRGMTPWPPSADAENELFFRMGRLLNDAFAYAHQLGVKTCLGTETPLVIPSPVKARLKQAGKNPDDPAVVQELYEGIFRRIGQTHPLDYFWLWTPEGWTWSAVSQAQIDATVADLRAAIAAHQKVKPAFTLATCGWVLGPPQQPALFDRFLPARHAHELHQPSGGERAGRAWFCAGSGAAQVGHSLAGRRPRAHVSAALGGPDAQGCRGCPCLWLHWPGGHSLADAALWAPTSRPWPRPRGSRRGDGVETRPRPARPHGRLASSALPTGRRLLRRLGRELSSVPRWAARPPRFSAALTVTCRGQPTGPTDRAESSPIPGPGTRSGAITPSSTTWPRCDRLCGAHGNLERFDYWLNSFQYMKAAARASCAWHRFNEAMARVKAEKAPEARQKLARELALPVRKEVLAAVADLHRYLLATVTTPGELGTVANWQQHNMPDLVFKPGQELAAALGSDLPADALPSRDYLGEPRMFVPVVRTSLAAGEPLPLTVIILGPQPSKGFLCWRKLGEHGSAFTEIPLSHVARGVWSVTLPPEATSADFEYFVQVAIGKNQLLHFPATAPEMNQTVVVTEAK